MLRSVKTLRFPRRDLRRVVLQPGVYKNKKKGHKSLHSKQMLIKGAGLSWSFLDYIELLKMKSSIQIYIST